MYLKSIRIEGFKSFADKTIFELKEGLTAIVGPNGSGKSNIVDAIRWALGEQSVKNLRGKASMSDVIFAGTDVRNAHNKASVALTFNNEDNHLNSEYKEIEVKRVVYKNGENEYFLNGVRVRLKDITNLFLDSNSGLDSFNIISQGSVTDIVNAKAKDRRIILESASGVLKYKKRKEESQRKLEKTNENLIRVNLIINELSDTVKPLKSESELASKYLELQNELKTLEISLTTYDITKLSAEYNRLKLLNEELNNKLNNKNFNDYLVKIEEHKLELLKIDEEINNINKDILRLTEEVSNINSEKNINIERSKFEGKIEEKEELIISLNTKKNNIIKNIDVYKNELLNTTNLLNEEIKKYNEVLKEKDEYKLKINILNKEYNEKEKIYFTKKNEKEILEQNIDNNSKIPFSVKSVLSNPRLEGLISTFNDLIDVPDKYITAADVILNSCGNFVICENEQNSKSAINYLKDNKLGKVTFFPLNIIKPKYVDPSIIERIEKVNGYVGILSDLIKYDKEYYNIVTNLLGNVIVVKNIDSMNLISKIIDYRYRVITLDGEITHQGGSITGGVSKYKSINNLKLDLTKLNNEILDIESNINTIKDNIIKNNKDYDILNERYNNTLVCINEYKNNINIINKNIKEEEDNLKNVESSLSGIEIISSSNVYKKVDELLVKLREKEKELEILNSNLNNKKFIKDDINETLSSLEKEYNKLSLEYKNIESEINKNNIEIGKYDVKLDNLLLFLGEEYNITYEYAYANYDIDNDMDTIRSKVNSLRKEIKSLGVVNLGSIKEYERLNTRYEFLCNQKLDLEVSINNLNEIIEDMDKVMIDKLKDTFLKVSNEFSNVFRSIFKGGVGKLELTDPDDYLNTGIELIAHPAGKKVNNTEALSGGEKSLTAICLLFAILNTSGVPFVILDEVEAALDEANVDMFGEYLSNKKEKSQFILITHKKRMMEYADTLYGITMEEAGVSKVVGVRLEDKK